MPAPANATRAARHSWLTWGSLLLVLAAPISFVLTLEQPFLRSTGALAFALLALGLLFALRGVVRRHRAARPILGAGVLLAGACVWGFFGLARLPQTHGVEAGALAPDFTLADSAGTRWSLRDARRQGPVLLVFYRGFW